LRRRSALRNSDALALQIRRRLDVGIVANQYAVAVAALAYME
jgi:hypothetical protein